ncbi:MAG: hypothetical protein DMG06_00610 [Acidobacteria bacterium]|nr:MAG: hypothetical protein DMG06_00610 [Acidobacteriota bacterium]
MEVTDNDLEKDSRPQGAKTWGGCVKKIVSGVKILAAREWSGRPIFWRGDQIKLLSVFGMLDKNLYAK